mgnify:CR=1 FL=1
MGPTGTGALGARQMAPLCQSSRVQFGAPLGIQTNAGSSMHNREFVGRRQVKPARPSSSPSGDPLIYLRHVAAGANLPARRRPLYLANCGRPRSALAQTRWPRFGRQSGAPEARNGTNERGESSGRGCFRFALAEVKKSQRGAI